MSWKVRIAGAFGQAGEFLWWLQGIDPVRIFPYLGYGTAERFLVCGRVLEDEGIQPADDADTRLELLLNFYKRFESDEVADARVRARYDGALQETVTDNDGYFRIELRPQQLVAPGPWHEVELELIDPPPRQEDIAITTARVLVPPETARFGVISDIDDTVIWTDVRNKLRMLLIVALLHEKTRMPFKGVAAFYQALQRGASGGEGNPIFYVSGSPWNLHDLLLAFFRIHGLPEGPILLRDIGGRTLFSLGKHRGHKLEKIEPILQMYPHLPFVLIGDSGEQDPEIYRDVVQKYPDRIRVIYIRSINPDPSRIAAIDALMEEVRKTNCDLVLVPDSEAAARHAAEIGLIAAADLELVRSGKVRDEKTTVEQEEVAEAKTLEEAEALEQAKPQEG